MADSAVVFAGITAHSVTHDGVMIGPAVFEALMTVPGVAGVSHFQGHIPGSVMGQLRQINTGAVSHFRRQVVGLVFTVELAVEGNAGQAQAEIAASDVVPAVLVGIIVTAIEPMAPVRAIQAIAVTTEHGQAGYAEREVRRRREIGTDANETGIIVIVQPTGTSAVGAVAFEEAVEEMDVSLAEETEETTDALGFHEVGLDGRQGTHVVA